MLSSRYMIAIATVNPAAVDTDQDQAFNSPPGIEEVTMRSHLLLRH